MDFWTNSCLLFFFTCYLYRWEKDNFFEAKKAQDEFQESMAPDAGMKVPEAQRKKLAEQAKRMEEGEETWQPTWQTLGFNFQRPLLQRKGPEAKD